MTQSEYKLEQALIKQLTGKGKEDDAYYDFVSIANEQQMLDNLKCQLEKHNNIEHQPFSPDEFKRIITHLTKSNSVFERAEILRDKYPLKRDDGSLKYISFLNTSKWCMNEYQITNQVTQHNAEQNTHKTRFDVTLLINGLPLVQIELKRRGMAIEEAFNQINRYQRTAYWVGKGLFLFVQMFVISNGANTRYYANNKAFNIEHTFHWTGEHNQPINDLHDFSEVFLRPCHISKMITHYTVLHQSDKCLMVFRPYQYYATEALIERVKNSNKNAYIWHTTGSGKTLTSFKASQVIMDLPEVDQVLFVVDRKDLDYQTAKEFNAFSEGSVDSTTNTSNLVKQLKDPSKKLIVTTIQKLNNAIINPRFTEQMKEHQHKKVVFIFDECHRSQFGETHKNIKKFFYNAQMFGFTGTPILEQNVNKNMGLLQTTKDLFDECLHKYVIIDAINDHNVLKFSVEYVGRYQYKNTSGHPSKNQLDIESAPDDLVADINTKEALQADERLKKIANYILDQHPIKTRNRQFNSMFCVSSVEVLIKYYELFKDLQKKRLAANPNYKPLKIATIFSYAPNEAVPDTPTVSGQIAEEEIDLPGNNQLSQSSRDKLDEFIADYNKQYQTKFSTKDSQSFYNYYKDIAKRVKEHAKIQKKKDQIDILLVVNMFLTGFDAKTVNTLFVDKNLQYHGLIQAFSRTNRIYNKEKSHGNIVCFRNLKNAVDDAIALFSNKNAKESVLVEPFEYYLEEYNKAVASLLKLTPTAADVDKLPDEEARKLFVESFRQLLRLQNILKSFADFDEDALDLPQQEFENFKSKYLDLYERVKRDKPSVNNPTSILDDVDFEITLIHSDLINVRYILALLHALHNETDEDEETKQTRKQNIIDLLDKNINLRSKRVLIKQFIQESMPDLQKGQDVEQAFTKFWDEQKHIYTSALIKEEQFDTNKFEDLIENYSFNNTLPREDEIAAALTYVPKIKERKSTLQRLSEKIQDYISKFIDDVL